MEVPLIHCAQSTPGQWMDQGWSSPEILHSSPEPMQRSSTPLRSRAHASKHKTGGIDTIINNTLAYPLPQEEEPQQVVPQHEVSQQVKKIFLWCQRKIKAQGAEIMNLKKKIVRLEGTLYGPQPPEGPPPANLKGKGNLCIGGAKQGQGKGKGQSKMVPSKGKVKSKGKGMKYLNGRVPIGIGSKAL